MKPKFIAGFQVRAQCPDCDGAVTTFEKLLFERQHEGSTVVEVNRRTEVDGVWYKATIYRLLKCAGCGRAGLAKSHVGVQDNREYLFEFFPYSIDRANLPSAVPDEIKKEFREAEKCTGFGAHRAASALIRSVLEKTLRLNGYAHGKLNRSNLQQKIDAAADDGVIHETRRKRAHEEIRALGNDVLHDEWREVTSEEFEMAHHYAQRILEDFYDDRDTVEATLKSHNRLPLPST